MKKRICRMLAFLSMLTVLAVCPSMLAEAAETRLTVFVTAMMAGEDNEALYAQLDPTMQAAIPRASFDLIWPQLSGQCGDFKGYYGSTEVTEIDGYTVLTQLLDMSAIDLLCTMSLNHDGSIAGLYFTFDEVPEPTVAPPARVREEKVSIGENPWKLPGTLLIPDSDRTVPAVVLVQGSGSTNRDEHIYAVRPFRDIANALSAKGIAVLRYDKRTYVYKEKLSSGVYFRNLTVEEEVIQDAISAGRLLAADERIDPERIYILGHSLGAMLAPRIVTESGDLFHGMILAAGTNKSFLEVLLRQAEDSTNLTEKQRATLIEDGEAIYSMTSAEEAKDAKFNGLYAYYYWEMLQHPTAAELLEALQRPTLIINGSRDIQVLEWEGHDTWEQALDMEAPWLTTYWTDVNHMLMRPKVSSAVWGTVGEYKVDCTVAEDITDTMAAFILNTEE